MLEKLKEIINNSYAPYSSYHVAALIITKDSKEISGVNVENASYGASVCAERVAIFKAISMGYKKGDFKELHILNDSGKKGMPCFICRQVVEEFFNPEDKIFVYDLSGDFNCYLVKKLCPYPFNSEDLKWKVAL